MHILLFFDMMETKTFLNLISVSYCPSANKQSEEKSNGKDSENIYKRKDGRWEVRYIASHDGSLYVRPQNILCKQQDITV